MSDETALKNLDFLAALYAQEVVNKQDDIENTVTKAMGVLQENGVYACFLYLLAKEGENGKAVVNGILDLLKSSGLGVDDEKPEAAEEILAFVSEKVCACSLEKMLLIKEILEQMLIYVRYGAKAKEKSLKPEGSA